MVRRVFSLATSSLLFTSVACSANVDDLFGEATGSGGDGGAGAASQGGGPSAGGSMTTGSMTTGSMTTGSMTTGSMTTGSMTTGSMTTGSMTTGSMTTGSMTTGSMNSSSSGGQPICGDGVVNQPNEDCDLNDFDGQTCTTFGFVNPVGLACSEQCAIRTSNCVAVCGNMTIEPGEDCDGGAGCSNMCTLTGGTTCGTAVPVSMGLGQTTLSGTTMGNGMYSSQDCSPATGPERVYAVTAQSEGFLTVWTNPANTNYDAVVAFRYPVCDFVNNEIACGDNFPGSPDTTSIYVNANQVVYLMVDGFNGASGSYEVVLDLSEGKNCSDPVPIPVSSPTNQITLSGTTVNKGADSAGSCGGNSQDVVYQLFPLGGVVVGPQDLQVVLQAQSAVGLDPIVYARSVCSTMPPQNELACDNPQQNDPTAELAFSTTLPTFVFVDGAQASQGTYELRIDD